MATTNIKVARQKKGMSQSELAVMLNTKPQAVCNWEKGRSIPSYQKLKKMSEILEEKIDYLLKETKE
jgi:transcriptional regulator with XRE-family HTH domain